MQLNTQPVDHCTSRSEICSLGLDIAAFAQSLSHQRSITPKTAASALKLTWNGLGLPRTLLNEEDQICSVLVQQVIQRLRLEHLRSSDAWRCMAMHGINDRDRILSSTLSRRAAGPATERCPACGAMDDYLS